MKAESVVLCCLPRAALCFCSARSDLGPAVRSKCAAAPRVSAGARAGMAGLPGRTSRLRVINPARGTPNRPGPDKPPRQAVGQRFLSCPGTQRCPPCLQVGVPHTHPRRHRPGTECTSCLQAVDGRSATVDPQNSRLECQRIRPRAPKQCCRCERRPRTSPAAAQACRPAGLVQNHKRIQKCKPSALVINSYSSGRPRPSPARRLPRRPASNPAGSWLPRMPRQARPP